RSWHGWHRHVSLVMLAYAVMASVRYQANSLKPKKTLHRTRQSLSAGPLRKSGALS
ncbi:IS701 family transposase, partial [Komagataeibacter pomaceti]|nr:IS701 family transposase [Novacetimonas pomaceti]